jgi:3-deoxy-D-manno-octulosonic-acid transferase
MYFVYSILLTLGFVILLPKFLLDALRHGKYATGLRERLGFLAPLEKKGGPVVWLHCVSVGEAQAARSLVGAISKEFPHHLIVVSTVTVTGQQVAREIFKTEAQRVFYFPLDWRWTVRRALRSIQPSVVLIMETELWPGFLRECRRRKILLAIVNGRLSEKSFRRYKMIRPFVSGVIDCLSLAVMQTEADATRIRALGLEPKRVVISGNMKFDTQAIEGPNTLANELARRFDFERSPIILAVSTHDPEERIILQAFNQLKTNYDAEQARLVIAPRHPERFAEVASLMKASGLRWARRSDQSSQEDGWSEAILLDSIGELKAIFPLAAIVFVGGSIAPAGGHNILEPAAAGACIVTGPHTENFREVVQTFIDAGAIIQLAPLSESELPGVLASLFAELLRDAERRQDLGVRAKAVVESNRGATARTMNFLNGILTDMGQAEDSPALIATQESLHLT